MKYNFEMDIDEGSSVGKISAQIKEGSQVLEFGPGNGRMTKYLIEAKKSDVSIVELDKELYDFVKEFSQDAFYGDIESFKWAEYYQNKKFDYIIFADVLEHLNNPLETLKKAAEFLSEEGEILITFPNLVHNSVMIDLFNNKIDWASYGLLDETHKSYYTHEGFHKVFKAAGLHVKLEDYTYLAVEDLTELTSSYTDLPVMSRYDFKMRPYGEVYQYFFSLTNNPEVKPEIAQPQNSNYVKQITFLANGLSEPRVVPTNLFTGENQTFPIAFPAEATEVTVQFEKTASIIEFKVSDGENNLPLLNQNGFALKPNLFIFAGETIPEIKIFDTAGKTLNFEIRYRYFGEFSKTFGEMFTLLQPTINENQELKKENQILQATNQKVVSQFQQLLKSHQNLKKNPSKKWLQQKKKMSRSKNQGLRFHLDQKIWQAETSTLKISGWAYGNEKNGLAVSALPEEVPLFEGKVIQRPDVNQAENLSEAAVVGFEAEIYGLTESEHFYLVLQEKNGQEYFVEI